MSPTYRMLSRGSWSMIARATVSPPTPLSKTPIGASVTPPAYRAAPARPCACPCACPAPLALPSPSGRNPRPASAPTAASARSPRCPSAPASSSHERAEHATHIRTPCRFRPLATVHPSASAASGRNESVHARARAGSARSRSPHPTPHTPHPRRKQSVEPTDREAPLTPGTHNHPGAWSPPSFPERAEPVRTDIVSRRFRPLGSRQLASRHARWRAATPHRRREPRAPAPRFRTTTSLVSEE